MAQYTHHLFTDNTSMHAVARCIEGCGCRSDLSVLFHLATAIMFQDAVMVGAFESKPVKDRTQSAIDWCEALGLGGGVFGQQEFTTEEYIQCCEAAAFQAASELERFAPTRRGVLRLANPDLSEAAWAIEEQIHSMLTVPSDKAQLEQTLPWPAVTAHHAVHLMLRTDALWQRVRSLAAGEAAWSFEHTLHLATILRCFLNAELGAMHDAHYLPSVARGRLLADSHPILWRCLARRQAGTLEDLSAHSLDVPEVVAELVNRSKGELHAFWYEAESLRNRLGVLRSRFSQVATNLVSADPRRRDRATREWTELRRIYVEQVAESRRGGTGNWTFVNLAGVPIPAPQDLSLVDGLREFRVKRRLAVLTTLVRRVQLIGVERRALRKLERQVGCEEGREGAIAVPPRAK